MKKRNATGSKPLVLDHKVVEGMAFGGASDIAIAMYLGISVDTLNRRAQETLDKGRETAKVRILQKQMELAMKGNPTMLIWLGKVRCGQTEKQQVEHTGASGGPLEIKVVYEIVDPPGRGAH